MQMGNNTGTITQYPTSSLPGYHQPYNHYPASPMNFAMHHSHSSPPGMMMMQPPQHEQQMQMSPPPPPHSPSFGLPSYSPFDMSPVGAYPQPGMHHQHPFNQYADPYNGGGGGGMGYGHGYSQGQRLGQFGEVYPGVAYDDGSISSGGVGIGVGGHVQGGSGGNVGGASGWYLGTGWGMR
jgi:hypothetical protein